MDRLWFRKVSHSSSSSILTSSAIRRDTVDGVVRNTFSICSQGVSVPLSRWAPVTDI